MNTIAYHVHFMLSQTIPHASNTFYIYMYISEYVT